MHKLLMLALLFTMHIAGAQITEDFSDGNFSANPAWSGDASQFIVNPQLQLQLNSTGAGLSYLSSALTQTTLDSVEWRCFARLDFSPSSTNNGKIYLVSDQANLEGPLQGYYIQLGESLSDDAVELFEQNGIVSTSIARCTHGLIANSFSIGIRVTRSINAEWRVYVDYSGGTNYSFEKSGINNTFNTSSYFGVVCAYSSSNATKFYFDDFFTGPIAVDSIPPVISTVTVISNSSLDVKFNEPLSTTSVQNLLNYSVNNGIGNPGIALLDGTDPSLVHLSFPVNFSPNVQYTLSINNVSDIEGNTMLPATSNFVLFPPAIVTTDVTASNKLDVKFSKEVDAISAQATINYLVNNSIGNPSVVQKDAADSTLIHLTFATGFTPGVIYTLSVTGVKDIYNSIMTDTTIVFALPDTARAGDIVINEILFNPFTGGSDFVELYNKSSKVIDLSQLRIANTDLATGLPDAIEIITSTKTLLYPQQYIVLTENPADIKSRYTIVDPNAFIDIPDLPTYNDDEDEVVLMDRDSNELERLHYFDDYHFPLLSDKEGVSLERISPERMSTDYTNWHSAASSAGYATPGYKNSQFSTSLSDGSEITLEPEIFSPDNDGHADVMNIHYKFEKPGFVANVKIYDSNGRPVLDLVKNELLGTEEGSWSWNGINNENQKAAIGIYILLIETYNTAGDVKKIKKTCVLAAKL